MDNIPSLTLARHEEYRWYVITDYDFPIVDDVAEPVNITIDVEEFVGDMEVDDEIRFMHVLFKYLRTINVSMIDWKGLYMDYETVFRAQQYFQNSHIKVLQLDFGTPYNEDITDAFNNMPDTLVVATITGSNYAFPVFGALLRSRILRIKISYNIFLSGIRVCCTALAGDEVLLQELYIQDCNAPDASGANISLIIHGLLRVLDRNTSLRHIYFDHYAVGSLARAAAEGHPRFCAQNISTTDIELGLAIEQLLVRNRR